MPKANQGDTVKVHYTGRLDDGTVFDSSEGREPLEFELGKGQVIPGFEDGVMGMSEGELRTITINSDQAYGPHRKEMEVVIDKKEFPDDEEIELGDVLQLRDPHGNVIPVIVTEINESSITLDANHPLAGKDLTFDIELVSVNEK